MAVTAHSPPSPAGAVGTLPPELRRLVERARPVALAREQQLPVLDTSDQAVTGWWWKPEVDTPVSWQQTATGRFEQHSAMKV